MYTRSVPSFRISIISKRTYIDQISHQDVYNFGSCGLLHDQCSKPSFSTNLRPISIQHSIRCTKDQCREGECRYTHNEHILIKGGIRMCRWRLWHFSFLIYYHTRMCQYAVMIVSTSAGAHQNSKLLFSTKLHPSTKLLRVLLVKSDISKYFWSALTGGWCAEKVRNIAKNTGQLWSG